MKKKVEVVPYNKPSGVTTKQRADRATYAAGVNQRVPGARLLAGKGNISAGGDMPLGSGRDGEPLSYLYKKLNKAQPYYGVAGSRGVELPGVSVSGIEKKAKAKKRGK